MMKSIPGYEGYAACEDGRIFSNKTGKFLTPTPNHKGYMRVQLSKDGKATSHSVHSLILLAFVGERPAGKVARHLNGNKAENALSNLAWGTPKQNEADKLAHGTRVCGERHPKSCITDEEVAEIRLAKDRGGDHWNSNALAERFGVKQDTIQKIASGRRRNSIALAQRERQQGADRG
ncbi:HNH endonuclease [Cupriavidus pauculus]|uniref:HNH endonuclease n=1 Tax=Cupriavidus pauculus TaxID=82633 RepID=UPI0030F79C8C